MRYAVIYKNEDTHHGSIWLNYTGLKPDDRRIKEFTKAARAEEEVAQGDDLPPGTQFQIIAMPDVEWRQKGGYRVELRYLDNGMHIGIGEFSFDDADMIKVMKEVRRRRYESELPTSLDFNPDKYEIVVSLYKGKKIIAVNTLAPWTDRAKAQP